MMILDAMFAHPRGLLGRLGGTIMARSTALRNAWVVDLLNVQPHDSILEVGFGPGAMIQVLLRRATEGFIAGIDSSSVMVQQAGQRNKRALREGRILLQQGSALNLPFENVSFDRVLSANSLPFWPDQLVGLTEMHRVLKPGGVIAIIIQPVWAKTDDEVKAIGSDITKLLTTVGFQQVRLEFKSMKPIASVCVLGRK